MSVIFDLNPPERFRYQKAPKLALWGTEGEGQGRAYVNPFNPDPDYRYPSVTTILGAIPKDLGWWRSSIVAEKAVERWVDLGRDPEAAVRWLMMQPSQFRDERAWVGGEVHAYIEAELRESWDFPTLITDEQREMIGMWRLFRQNWELDPLHVELTVVNEKHGYMGTLDFIGYVTDRLTGETFLALLDWKSSKSLWDSSWEQLAGLMHADYGVSEVPEPTETSVELKRKGSKEVSHWERVDLPEFDKVGILHIRAEGVRLVFEPLEHMPLHFRNFLAARERWQVNKELAALRKASE